MRVPPSHPQPCNYFVIYMPIAIIDRKNAISKHFIELKYNHFLYTFESSGYLWIYYIIIKTAFLLNVDAATEETRLIISNNRTNPITAI